MVAAILSSHLTQELSFTTKIQRNQLGSSVKRVQEWLYFHKFATTIDGDFGPATEKCVRDFQAARALPVTGVVDRATYMKLVEPLAKAVKEIQPAPGETLASMVLKYAKQHLAQHPIELGGQNRGPWVRAYMQGNEGQGWPWCAGFVTFVLKQACATLNLPMPIAGSFSCDQLATQARQKSRLVSDSDILNNPASWSALRPCCIFLVRKQNGDWTHTGFAFERNGDIFATIEGNTNDSGSAEGYEVCKRVRGLSQKDFIRLA